MNISDVQSGRFNFVRFLMKIIAENSKFLGRIFILFFENVVRSKRKV